MADSFDLVYVITSVATVLVLIKVLVSTFCCQLCKRRNKQKENATGKYGACNEAFTTSNDDLASNLAKAECEISGTVREIHSSNDNHEQRDREKTVNGQETKLQIEEECSKKIREKEIIQSKTSTVTTQTQDSQSFIDMKTDQLENNDQCARENGQFRDANELESYKLTQQKKENSILKIAIEKLREEITRKESENTELNEELHKTDYTGTIENTISTLSKLFTERDQIREECYQLKLKLKENNEKLLQKRDEKEQYPTETKQKVNSQTMADQKMLKDTIENFKKCCEEIKKEYGNLHPILVEFEGSINADICHISREFENINANVKEKQRYEEQLQNKIKKLQKNITENTVQYDTDKAKLQRNVEQLQTKIQQLEKDGKCLEEKINEKDCKLDKCKIQLKTMEREINVYTEQVSKLEKDKKQLQECNESLSGKFNDARTKLSDIEKNRDQLATEKYQLVDELGKAKAKIANFTSHKDVAEEQDNQNSLSLSGLTPPKVKLKNTKDILHTEMEAEIKDLQEETKRVTDCLQKENSESQASKGRICIMCINQEKLSVLGATFQKMKAKYKIPTKAEFIEKRLRETLKISKSDFEEADNVIMVAIGEPRNMIISDSEPSQLGAAYRKAVELQKKVFMILYVHDATKEKLKDNQAYHTSLAKLFESQKSVGSLAEDDRFISIKHEEKKGTQKLNKTQEDLIINWIKQCTGDQ